MNENTIYEDAVNNLPTEEELFTVMNTKDLFMGKEAVVSRKTYKPLKISENGNIIEYCGIIIRRILIISDEDFEKYGIRVPRADWFSYNGFSVEELKEGARSAKKKLSFDNMFRTDNILLNAEPYIFKIPRIIGESQSPHSRDFSHE